MRQNHQDSERRHRRDLQVVSDRRENLYQVSKTRPSRRVDR